jgi:Flp pilus assembly protein TadG
MTGTRTARRGWKQKGQSVVEMALITPLLLAVLYVAADFGIAFMMGNLIATAAQDGARIGSGVKKTGGTSTDDDFRSQDADIIRNAIQTRVPSYLTSPKQIIVTFYEDDGTPCWESVQVEVRGNYNFTLYKFLKLFGASVPNNVTISRTTRMRYNFQQYNVTAMCTNANLAQTYSL